MPTTYLLLFAANLAFILTNLYGWLLKWFYRPRAYDGDFERLFPAQRAVGWLYLLQVLELPYLLHIAEPQALLYVNAFSVLVFSLQMLVMCEGYFFPESPSPTLSQRMGVQIDSAHKSNQSPSLGEGLGVGLLLLPLLLQAVGLIRLPDWHRTATFVAVGLLFVWYFWRTIGMALRIGRAVRCVNEDNYADSDDFPTRFGEKIQWLPTGICVLMAVNFFIDDPLVKAFRDVLFTMVNIWFCIYTLNPWRKPFDISGKNDRSVTAESVASDNRPKKCTEPSAEESAYRLTDERYTELSHRLESLLTDERIFTQQHITADMLMQRLGINANYLTEVIQRSGYSSFYDMVSQHRVRHAISLICQHPDRRMADIAYDCGFTSQSSMTKAFTSQGKDSPSSYRKKA